MFVDPVTNCVQNHVCFECGVSLSVLVLDLHSRVQEYL